MQPKSYQMNFLLSSGQEGASKWGAKEIRIKFSQPATRNMDKYGVYIYIHHINCIHVKIVNICAECFSNEFLILKNFYFHELSICFSLMVH